MIFLGSGIRSYWRPWRGGGRSGTRERRLQRRRTWIAALCQPIARTDPRTCRHRATELPKPIEPEFFCHDYLEYDEAAERAWLDNFTPYCEELGVEPELTAATSNLVPFGEAHCRLVEEIRPTVASFHFGLPEEELLRRVKRPAAA